MKYLLHACVLSLSMLFAGAAFAQPTPYPEQNSDYPGKGVVRKFKWMEDNRNHYWTLREKDQGKVVFVGDSLTQGWKTLNKDLPEFPSANRGIGGDVSRGVLFRFKEDVLDLNPRAVVLHIGINDLTAHGKPADTLHNISLMLDMCKEHNEKMPVILCTVPMTQNPKAPVKENDWKALNAGIRELAASRENVELCDLEKALLDAEGNFDPTNYRDDQLHLAAPGYEKWKAALKPLLEKVLAEPDPQN